MSHQARPPGDGPRERVIDIPGLRLAARVWGPDDGVKVLALHGWLDNAASFDRLAPRLPDGLQLVALDLPGHGRSQHRGHATYHFIDYVADACAVVEALGWRRFAILGHSLGAGVGSLLAGTVPERVERMVLLEGIGPLTESEDEAPRVLADAVKAEAKRAARTRDADDAPAGQTGGRPARPRRVFPDLAAAVRARLTASAMTEDAARTLIERSVEATEGGFWWRTDPRLRLPSRVRLSEGQTRAFLRAIDCPVLLVHARDGLRFSEEIIGERIAAVRTIRVVSVPGRHHVHLDDPGVVAAAIGSFLHNGS